MCEQLQALSEAEFLDAINSAFHNASDATFIGAVPQIILGQNFEAPPLIDKVNTKRFSFPLANTHATSYAAERLALIGDAAHRVHPLAG
jgi:2-polyprenyl-6-methoxyphenol hydroxylase-like FAD-dependent oxidoreductase